MGKKKECNTYIVHLRKTIRGTTTSKCIGRYAVGAKNEKEAIEISRNKLGKINKLSVYYKSEENFMQYGQLSLEKFENGKWVHYII